MGDLRVACHDITDVLDQQHDEARLTVDTDLEPAVGPVGEHIGRPGVVGAQHLPIEGRLQDPAELRIALVPHEVVEVRDQGLITTLR